MRCVDTLPNGRLVSLRGPDVGLARGAMSRMSLCHKRIEWHVL